MISWLSLGTAPAFSSTGGRPVDPKHHLQPMAGNARGQARPGWIGAAFLYIERVLGCSWELAVRRDMHDPISARNQDRVSVKLRDLRP
jgi:hypothetical protein